MYQTVFLSHKRTVLAAAAFVLTAGTALAADPVVKCRDTIANSARKYTNATMKILQKCEEGVVKGTVTGPCPDAAAATKINDAATKLADKINDKCAGVALADMGFAGKVNRCVGGTGNGNRCVDINDCLFPPVTIGLEDGTCTPVDECPAFLNGRLFDGCDLPLSTPQTVADCIECAALSKVGTVVDTFYRSLRDPSTDGDDLKCQKEIGKRAAKYFDAVEKALTKCERDVIKGKIPGPCPDTKAADKITKALAKLDDKVPDACSDAARVSRAIKPADLYSTANRWGSCGTAAAGTPQGLADLLECVAENAATCDSKLASGSNVCSIPLCGNGQIDAGETCDPGDTVTDDGVGPADICPSDCSVAPCTVNGTDTVTVTFAGPTGVDLTGFSAVITYPDSKVSLPGPGSSDVSARVTPNLFSATATDLEYGVRLIADGGPANSGTAFTIDFDTCQGGGALAAGEIGCMVVSGIDNAFNDVDGGITCTVTP